MITLDALTAKDMEQVRIWRAGVPETLRTPYMLTAEMQRDYYERVICNRDSRTRYWALREHVKERRSELANGNTLVTGGNVFIGYGGIENIEWENGCGEISLLIRPELRGKGYGKQAVALILQQAFDNMRLVTVHGECYKCGPWGFWQKMIAARGEKSAELPCRKYHDGIWWHSFYFTFDRGNGWQV